MDLENWKNQYQGARTLRVAETAIFYYTTPFFSSLLALYKGPSYPIINHENFIYRIFTQYWWKELQTLEQMLALKGLRHSVLLPAEKKVKLLRKL